MKAEKNSVNHRLAIVRGQVEGVIRMVEDDAYCVDISNQILAIISGLKKVNQMILSAHLEHCLRHAQGEELDNKISEIENLLNRL